MPHAAIRPLAIAALALAPLAPATALAQASPRLGVTTVMEGLRGPWDIAFAPDGTMLFTEKCHGLSARLPDGSVRRLFGNREGYALVAPDLFCEGQSGVHGVAVDPGFAGGRRFVYVFVASNLNTRPRSNRIVRLAVSPDWAGVADRRDIVTDIAFKDDPRLGRPGAHSGGRIAFGPDGYLWIATGDNHDPGLPQDPRRLGGKVLRIDTDGRAAPGNNAPAGFDPRIYTYGHRNPQGLAFRPGTGQAFTAEHGPNHSDEITPLVAGGNAGWDPQNRPGLKCDKSGYCGYNGDARTMPMTDTQRFPKAIRPAWNNDGKSEGAGPLVFLDGPQWGAWNGRLAVAYMRGLRIDVLALDTRGMATGAVKADLPPLRVRSLVRGPDGKLWASTDEGRIVTIAPR